MNQMCIYLPIKPLSVNDSIYPSSKTIKLKNGKKKLVLTISQTKDANIFKKKMRFLLLQHLDEINSFAMRIGENNIYIECRYIFWIPKSDLITQRGTISKTSMDIDNCVKYFQDCVFSALGIKNNKINDALVLKYGSVDKRISPRGEFGVTMHMLSRVFDETA